MVEQQRETCTIPIIYYRQITYKMNGKLYIFGIGGTGSRVIKSLVMLASSGVKINADSIIPIIIDPDFANADVTRTIEQIKTYVSIRERLAFNEATHNNFFGISIQNVAHDYRLTFKDTPKKKFKEFIEFSTLSKENQALASILFSEANLEADMEVGFKGNPNIGSVTLNQFEESHDFINFSANFKPGDRIFIVSSIFGGTGASGFPLLLKNLRGLKPTFPNSDAIQHAPIGAITVLPYFAVKPDEESSINSSTFIGKTKAALQYYEKNVTGDKSSVNVLYYIGDERTQQYENKEGGVGQRNNAHIVELAAAMSIIDFASIPDEDSSLMCEEDDNAKIYATDPYFKEFGIENDAQEVLFSNLTQKSRNILCTPMTQFTLFSKYIQEHLQYPSTSSQPWAKDNKLDNAFLNASFVINITKYTKSYIEWLNEMAENDRAFKPYKLTVSGSDLYSLVDGIKPYSIKALWAFIKSGYDLFDAALNEEHTSLSKNLTSEQKFMELFYNVTLRLVEKKYKF